VEIHQLRYVVAAGKYLNFTKAADSLHISQPSLSQQIAKLEQELGTPLFSREARNISLTPAGKDFVAYAEKVLEDLEHLEKSVSSYKTTEKKTLTVGIVTTIGDFGFRDMLLDFRDTFPGVEIKTVANTGEGLLKALHESEVDACIIMCPDHAIEEQGLRYLKLVEDPLVAVLSARNELAAKDSFSFADFRDEPVFASPAQSRPNCVGVMRLVRDCFAAEGIQKTFLEYLHIDEVLQRVAANEGVVFMLRHSMLSRPFPKLVIRPVLPKPILSQYLVCKPDCEHVAMDALFTFAQTYSYYQDSFD